MKKELTDLVQQLRRDLDAFHVTTGERLSRILRELQDDDAPTNELFPCPECGHELPTAERLAEHLANVHGKGW